MHPPTPVTTVDMRGRCYAANTSSEQANWWPVVSRRRVPALIKPTRERVADTLSTRRHRTRSQRQLALALASDDLARLVPTERAVVFTGTGGHFIFGIDFSSLGNVSDPGVWSQVHDEGVQILENLLSIRVPVLAVSTCIRNTHSSRT
jgi:enoyl-CoA hydratase/carnithine racemase